MRWSTIPAIRRNLVRAREILSVLSKYGLAEGVRWIGPNFAKDFIKAPAGEAIARQPWESRLRMAMTEMGPSFIKLGQFLSTRSDLIGVRLADELKQLQGDVPPDPFSTVVKILEKSLGRPLGEIFSDFDETPVASGSIGQAHRARIRDTGQEVIVKVRHPDIRRKIAVDLDILSALASRAERYEEYKNYNPVATVDEFRRTLMRELDFRREARHLERFGKLFAGNPNVRIPGVYRKYSCEDVLTMEYLDGIKLSDHDALERAGYDLGGIARSGAGLYIEMIFQHRIYHADPHPGNILILDGGIIGMIDFGNVGQLDEPLQESIEEALLAVSGQDAEQLASIVTHVGKTTSGLDHAGLSLDLEDFIGYYGTQSLDGFDVSGALNEMTEIIRRYRIQLPPRLAILIKVLVTLEGTAKGLSPRFDLLEVMRPYRVKMLRRRLSPKRYARKSRRFMLQMERAARVMPEGLIDLFQRLQAGTFAFHMDHQGLEPSVNRLVLGMLTSALFLGSSWMVSSGVRPLLGDLPYLIETGSPIGDMSILGGFGLVFSAFLGFRLLRAIHNSGDLD
jgi:ubiquinone biosynthesis protein